MLHATIAPSMADSPPDLPSTVPAGSLLQIPSFITSEEALGVLNFLDGDDGNSWQYEGFERRRRVRRFARPAGSSEGSEEGSGQGSGQGDRDGFGALLDAIAHRVARQISAHDGQEEALCPPPPHLPTQIVAEERPQSSFGGVDPINHWSKPKLRRNSASVNPMPNVTVTAFESEDVCGCGRSSDQAENQYPLCGCYVAQLALGLPAVQRINMPAVRDLECWELASSEHYARIPMPTNSLTVKRGEVLNGWRGRVDVPHADSLEYLNYRQEMGWFLRGMHVWGSHLMITFMSVLVAPLGVATAHLLRPAVLRRVFGIYLLVVGVTMIAKY